MLRKKWKYLRDQFSVEFGKMKPPRSGDPAGESYESKWPHYKSLLFLKDIVNSLPSEGVALPPAMPEDTYQNLPLNPTNAQ